MGEDMPSSKKRNNGPTELIVNRDRVKIGRASCRERVYVLV